MLESEWELWKLAHAYGVIGSGTTPTSGNEDYYSDETGVPWVTTSELRESYIARTSRNVTEAALKNFPALRVYAPNSVFIAMYGATIGRLGVSTVDATCNQACCVFESSEVFDNRFLFYWLWHRRGELISLSVGGGQPNLSQQDLKSEKVPCPPIEKQKRIAVLLDTATTKIDALITKKQALLERLAEKRQAIITQAVTKGLDPSAPMKDSGVDWLGQVPVHWTITHLGYRYEVQLGRMLNAERASGQNLRPYLRVLDVQWDFINVFELPEMDFPPEAQQRYRLKTGDLLVNEGGSYVGRSAIWRGDLSECYYQKALHRLRPYEDKRDTSEYLLFVFEAATKNGVFSSTGGQTTIDHLTAEQLRRYKFPFPPYEEQCEIARQIRSTIFRLQAISEKIEDSVQKLIEYRSALITAALTGRIEGLQ